MANNQNIVLYDPALGLAPVFKPLSKSGPRGKLDVETTHAELTLRWRGPDELSIQDETLLLAVLLLARSDKEPLEHHDEAPASRHLWRGLQPTGFYDERPVIMTTASFSALAEVCGRGDGGSSISQIRDGLKRLTEVTVWVKCGPAEASSRLLSWIVGDDKRVLIAVNRRLAEVLTGAQYVKIDLEERRQLRSTTAQALHSRLSSQLRAGKHSSITLDRIEFRIWGASSVGATRRKRHQRLLAAFEELGWLQGWTVEQTAKDRFSVTRNTPPGSGRRAARIPSKRSRSPALAMHYVG